MLYDCYEYTKQHNWNQSASLFAGVDGLDTSSEMDTSSDADTISAVDSLLGVFGVVGVVGVLIDLVLGERGERGVLLRISSIGSTLSMLSIISRCKVEIAVAAELANCESAVRRRRVGEAGRVCRFGLPL